MAVLRLEHESPRLQSRLRRGLSHPVVAASLAARASLSSCLFLVKLAPCRPVSLCRPLALEVPLGRRHGQLPLTVPLMPPEPALAQGVVAVA